MNLPILQYFYMQNEDRVDVILDSMEKACSPQQFSAGLQILYKLIHNIITSPFDPKFRNVKTSNNTIKTKVMNLKGIENLLKQLGYVLENGDTYVLKDERVAEFLQGTPAVDYRRRLASARLESDEAYKKQLLVVKEHKAQHRDRLMKQKEAQRLKDQCKYDAEERKHMKADTTQSKDLKFGTKTTTWSDIGVDLCDKKKG